MVVNTNFNVISQSLKAPSLLFKRSSRMTFHSPPPSLSRDSIKLSTNQSFKLPSIGFASPVHLFQRTTVVSPPKVDISSQAVAKNHQSGNPSNEVFVASGIPATIYWGQKSRPQNSPRIPAGYGRIRGQLPRGLSQVASHILKKGNPLGTYTPFSLGGKEYIALNEYHSKYADPVKEAARKKSGRTQIYAVTVFQKL